MTIRRPNTQPNISKNIVIVIVIVRFSFLFLFSFSFVFVIFIIEKKMVLVLFPDSN